MKTKTLCIYHDYIPKVGGIESAVYSLAEVLAGEGIDVTIAYHSCESYESLFRYAKVADVYLLPDNEVECDVCLLASNHEVPKGIKAERFVQWIHSDYERYNLKLKNVNLYKEGKLKYVAVSQHAARIAKKLYGVEATVIKNILGDFKVRKNVLTLVTNSRVSPEKGFGRIYEFAKGLKDNGIEFQWFIYGDNSHFPNEYNGWVTKFSDIPEVIFCGYRDDVSYGLYYADYLVQLSDWEGCPYSVLEALKSNVPCIVTKWGGVEELVEDGVNGYILPMTMQRIPYKKIATKIPRDFTFSQAGLKTKWLELID